MCPPKLNRFVPHLVDADYQETLVAMRERRPFIPVAALVAALVVAAHILALVY